MMCVCVCAPVWCVKLDDLRPDSRMPVILQPADSGTQSLPTLHITSTTHFQHYTITSNTRNPPRRHNAPRLRYTTTSNTTPNAALSHLPTIPTRPRPLTSPPVPTGFNTEHRSLAPVGPSSSPRRRLQHAFLRLMVEPQLQSPGVSHFRGVEMLAKEVEAHIDLDYVLYLIAYLGRLTASEGAPKRRPSSTTPSSSSSRSDDPSRHVVRRLLHAKLGLPVRVRRPGPAWLVYLELFHHSSLVLTLEFLAGPKQVRPPHTNVDSST